MSTHTGAAGFNEFLQTLAQFDMFSGILPFVLTYVIFFVVLKKRMPVIKENNKIAALISVIIAFYVSRFVTVSEFYQGFMQGFFGRLVIFFMGLFGLALVLAFTGYDITSSNMPLLGIIAVLITGAAFTASGGFTEFYTRLLGNTPIADPLTRSVNFALDSGLIWIILIALALVWVSSEDESSETDPREIFDWLFGRNAATGEGPPE